MTQRLCSNYGRWVRERHPHGELVKGVRHDATRHPDLERWMAFARGCLRRDSRACSSLKVFGMTHVLISGFGVHPLHDAFENVFGMTPYVSSRIAGGDSGIGMASRSGCSAELLFESNEMKEQSLA